MRAKVLLIQEYIPHYRVPVFNELAKHVDLTVVFSEGNVPEDKKFNCMKISTFKFYYKIHKKNIFKLAKQYDVVISLLDFSFLTNRLMSILRLKKYKIAYWGIGVPAGYNKRYDNDDFGVLYDEVINGAVRKHSESIIYSYDEVTNLYKMDKSVRETYSISNDNIYKKSLSKALPGPKF